MAVRSAVTLLLLVVLVIGLAPAGADDAHAVTAPRPPERTRILEPTPEVEADPDTVLVRFRSGLSRGEQRAVATAHGGELGRAVASTGFHVVHTDGRKPEHAAGRLRADRRVLEVAPNLVRRSLATPNDPHFATYQSYLQAIRLPQAWDVTRGSDELTIAILDTGVDRNHIDLKPRLVPGYNAIDPSRTVADDNGHGTMVAGIAAAETNNAIGVAGVAWRARIMPVKVLDRRGYGTDAEVAAGIMWAADRGADVINLSLGGPGESVILTMALDYAIQRGSVVVAAAGNSGSEAAFYPAAHPGVISVGAVDEEGRVTYFSTWGDTIDVAAPGWDVVSTALGGTYDVGDGTSFAAPIVAGVALLVRTRYPAYTPAQVRSRIRTTARDAGPPGLDPYFGHGIVDALAAVGGTAVGPWPATQDGHEPNDRPSRARPVTGDGSPTISPEGDADWWYHDHDAAVGNLLAVTVTPPVGAWDDPTGLDPVIRIYGPDGDLITEVDEYGLDVAETATVPARRSGRYLVHVRNDNGSVSPGGYRVDVEIRSEAPILFGPAVERPVGSWPESVAIDDVTGDGRADVVLTTSFYFDAANDYHLFTFAQQPDGALAAPTKQPTAVKYGDRAGVATGDLDGDGHADVAVATKDGVQLFLQRDGVLVESGIIASTANATQVEAADVDGDGVADLVVRTSAGVLFLRGTIDGPYQRSVVTTDVPLEIEVGDVTGDGRPDVVGILGVNAVVYAWTESGFEKATYPLVGPQSWRNGNGVTVGDLNGDGRLDVAATLGGNSPNARVNVFLQRPDGTMGTAHEYTSYDLPQTVEAADIDGDGRDDLLVLHGGWSRMSLYLQRPDGTLGDVRRYPIPTQSHYNRKGLAVGDINGDGRPDVAISTFGSGLVTLLGRVDEPAEPVDVAPVWIADISPADRATMVPIDTEVTVTSGRELDPSTVTSATVTLIDGHTGSTVAATVGYDGSTRRITVTPTANLVSGRGYQVRIRALRDTADDLMTRTERVHLRTVTPPPPVHDLKAMPGIGRAVLSWTNPEHPDVAGVAVRMAVGTTPPSGPVAGTGVYSGTGQTVTRTGLAAGTDYSFSVFTHDARTPRNWSGRVTRTLRGTALTVGRTPSTVTYGEPVTVTGRLTRSTGGAAVSGHHVELQGRKVGSTSWRTLATKKTSSSGAVSFSHQPSWNIEYRLRYAGSGSNLGAVSSTVRAHVRPVVTATVNPTSMPLGRTATLAGKVSPGHAGHVVELQRYRDDAWRTVARQQLSSKSTYSFSVKPGSRGSHRYRVRIPAHDDHAAGASPARTLKVT